VSQWTAFHAACFAGRANCAEVLIRAGCDITAKDSQGCTALGYAEEIGHTAVLEMLQTLAKKEKKNRKRREQRKRAQQSRRSTAAGQADRELDEEPAAGLHSAAQPAQPEATAAQGGQAERGALEIPVGDWHCDHMCGFKGHHAEVAAHELSCGNQPGAASSSEDQSQVCGRFFFPEEKHTIVPGQQPQPQSVSEIGCKFEPEPEANAELDLQSNHESNPSVPETKALTQADDELHAEIETELQAEPEEKPLAGPMAEFGEAEVQRWLGTVDGLTAEQLQRVRAKLVEEKYDGEELMNGTNTKTFRRLLRGTGVEETAPLLLAAHDRYIHDSGAGVQLPVSPCRTLSHLDSHPANFRITLYFTGRTVQEISQTWVAAGGPTSLYRSSRSLHCSKPA
jgi:hypothetical protein